MGVRFIFCLLLQLSVSVSTVDETSEETLEENSEDTPTDDSLSFVIVLRHIPKSFKNIEHNDLENSVKNEADSLKYDFKYGIQDHDTGDMKYHQESRHGNSVTGKYLMQEADGTLRRVEYTADEHGFRAEVHKVEENDTRGGSSTSNDAAKEPFVISVKDEIYPDSISNEVKNINSKFMIVSFFNRFL